MTDPKARALQLADEAWRAAFNAGDSDRLAADVIADYMLTFARELLAREPTEAMVKSGTPVIYEMVGEDKPSPLIAYQTWRAMASELAKELG